MSANLNGLMHVISHISADDPTYEGLIHTLFLIILQG